MKKKTSLAIVFILLVSTAVGATVGAMCSRNATGLSMELTVRERSGVARHSEPVTSGVPFARSAGIKSTDGFTVTDAAGRAVPARSRATVDVNMDVGAGEDVSCRVTAGQPIVAERPMYFDYHGKWAGGHVAMGTAGPGTEWHFAEGCTR